MNKGILTSTSLIIAVVLLLAVNIVSNAVFKSTRVDLTENHLYTLSQGSKNILKTIDEPITLRFYFSQKLAIDIPGINSYAQRVRELLEEYQRIAGKKLNLKFIDPEPFSEAEDRAVAYGLQGVPVEDGKATLYFGLAGLNATDDKQIISFFQPEREEFLEYDITQLIYRLVNPEPKVIGLISTLPMQGTGIDPLHRQRSPEEPWMVMEQIGQLFQVRTLETDVETIPDDLDVLMVVHPKNLSEGTRYAIDQFVLRGGRTLIFVDPFAEADEPETDPNNPLAALRAPRDSNLPKLFAAWGVQMLEHKVAADLEAAQQIQARQGNRVVRLPYPVYISMDKDNFNAEDVITRKLGRVILASAGILQRTEGAKTEWEPLIETGKQSMAIDVNRLRFGADPEQILRDFQPEDRRLILAARITGSASTAYPEGRPKVDDAQDSAGDDAGTQLTESVGPINLIVVSDTDLLQDKFWVQVQNFLGQRIALPVAANASLVINALDNLSGSSDLISVRNRGRYTRPFTKLQAIQQEAEQRFREKEKELLARLRETEQKIRELQNKKQEGDVLMLTVEQQEEIARFRAEKLKIRKELRHVQHELRKNIERLEAQLKFINIGLMPLVIGIGGVGISLYRIRRRKRHLRPAKGN
jgi:ABC-type uncharacterized transport system involved in gliding motility auxiliary subunit